MPNFTLSSNRLLDRLEQVQQQARGQSKVTGRLSVNESADWWILHEFGTASRQDTDGYNVPETTHPEGYSILPKNGKGLVLPATGGHPRAVILPYVGDPGDGRQPITANHPGVRPLALVRSVLTSIREAAGQLILSTLRADGYNTSGVKSAIIGEVMPEVKEQIVQSISDRLRSGDSPTAKLRGQDPSTVFAAAASISEVEGS